MTRRVVVSPTAERDADGQALYIADDSPEAALRFYAALDAALDQLARMPELGSPRDFGRGTLSGLRAFRLRGFERHLVFYRVTPEAVEVVRVLHSSQDVEAIFLDVDD